MAYRWMFFSHTRSMARSLGLLLAIGFTAVATMAAAEPEPAAGSEKVAIDDLLEMDIEDLLSLEIVSVARKSQLLSEAAAAVYVITAEDI